MKLSTSINLHNEAKTIRTNRRPRCVRRRSRTRRIIIVDDCSRRRHRDLLRTQIAPSSNKIIYHEVNQGKARRSAPGSRPRRATAVIVRTPTSNTIRGISGAAPADYRWSRRNVVSARVPRRAGAPRRVFLAMIGNKVLTLLSNMGDESQPHGHGDLLQGRSRREVIQKIKIERNRFGFEPEIHRKVAN